MSDGEPPRERWDDILKNTREKSRADALAEVLTRTGIDLNNPDHVWNVRAFLADPGSYIERYGKHYGYTVSPIERAAAANAAGRAPAPTGFKMPEPGLTAEDGRAAYDAKQVDTAIAYLISEIESLQQIVTPISDGAKFTRAVQQQSSRVSHYEATLPGFKELKPRIAELVKAHNIDMLEAYTHLLPEFHSGAVAKSRQSAIDELKTAPAPPTGVSVTASARGGGGSSSGRKRTPTTREAVRQAAERLAGQ